MDWTQALTIIGINVALFIYLSNRMENLRSEMKSEIRDSKSDIKTEMNQRFSDVNQRLTTIETENKDISKRLSSIESYLVPKKVFHFEEPKHEEEPPKEN